MGRREAIRAENLGFTLTCPMCVMRFHNTDGRLGDNFWYHLRFHHQMSLTSHLGDRCHQCRLCEYQATVLEGPSVYSLMLAEIEHYNRHHSQPDELESNLMLLALSQ